MKFLKKLFSQLVSKSNISSNKNNNEDINNSIQNISKIAIKYGKEFNKNLDFSENSLHDVEEILEYYHKDLRSKKVTENQIWSMSTIWGVYLGIVIQKHFNRKCKWSSEDVFGAGGIMHLKFDDDSRVFPIDKVCKRLTNGSEDNIISFYNILKKEIAS